MVAKPSTTQFAALRDLWLEHRDTIEAGAVPELGLRGAVLSAAVLFADMVGFTDLTNEYPVSPGVAAFVAHHFFSLAENWCIGSSGVTDGVYVDKILGDGILLVIPGAQTAAVTKALRVVRSMTLGPHLYPVRLGLHWGQVCLCDVGLPEGPNRTKAFEQITVMGTVVNLAARLATSAEGASVALLAEPIPELGITPTAIPASVSRWGFTRAGICLKVLKGFTGRELRVASLRSAPVIHGVIDRQTMLGRVQELTSQLPRIPSTP